MMRSLRIQNKTIILESPLQFIQGRFDFGQLGDFSKNICNWNQILTNIQQSPIEILPYLLSIPSSQTNDITQIREEFFTQFKTFIQLRTQIDQNIQKFQALSAQQKLEQEYAQAKQLLTEYVIKKQKSSQLSQNSLLASKQDLLKKLQLDEKNVNQLIGTQQDRFSQNENRMQQLQTQLDNFNSELETVQIAQRALFKETNQLTKQMDELSERKEVYEEKLFDLDPDENKEDYDRISEKLKPLKEQYDQLKGQRTTRMQQSKEIQEQIKNFQTSIKETATKIQTIQPEYNQLHSEYSALISQLESISKRIEELEPEIVQLENKEKTKSNMKNTPQYQFSSETLLSDTNLRKLAETDTKVQEQLDHIQGLAQKLQENGIEKPDLQMNLNSAEITTLMQEINNIQGKLEHLEKDYQIENKVTLITTNLKRLQVLCNELLISIEFSLRFELSIDFTAESPIKLSIHLQHKNKMVPFNDDLKRLEKAMISMALILGFLRLTNEPILPIHYDTLPDFIITKQTFLKILENIRSVFAVNPNWKDWNVVFFLTEATLEVSPKYVLTK